MARRRRQRDGVVERVVVIDQKRLPRLDDRQAIVAENSARRIGALLVLLVPGRIFALVEDVFGIRKGRHPAAVAQRGVPAGVVDVQMRAEDVVDLVVGDAEGEELVAPALLAREIERRRMTLVLAGAGVDQDGVAWRAHHEGLVGDEHLAGGGVEDLRLHAGQMMLEHSIVIGGKEVLRPAPRPLAFDHRIDGDIADPKLLHDFLPPLSGKRSGSPTSIQATRLQLSSASPAPRGRGRSYDLPREWKRISPLSVPLEILHGTLVPFGRSARFEGAEITAPAGLRIDLARVEPVLTGSQLADHDGPPGELWWGNDGRALPFPGPS